MNFINRQFASSLHSLLICLSALLLLTVAMPETLLAQDRQQRRRDLVEGLLKTLIESQLDKNRPQGNRIRPGVPNARPGNLPSRPQPIQPTQAMRGIRKQLASWERDSAALVTELQRANAGNNRNRLYLAEAIQLTADVRALNSQCQRVADHRMVVDRFRSIDSQWRILNHQIRRQGGVSRECIRCLDRILGYDKKLCSLFEIQPQFDRRQLMRYCVAMASHFEHLSQDIYFDLRGVAEQKQLLSRCQTLTANINSSAALIERGSYDAIVRAYQQNSNEWGELRYQLAGFPSERIRRDIHSIQELGTQINELLWLPEVLDRRFLVSTIASIEKDMDRILRNVSMKQLLETNRPGVILSSAREFRSECARFSQALNANQSQQELGWSHRQFDQSWRRLHEMLHLFKIPSVNRKIDNIDEDMLAFREIFGAGPVINRQTMLQICTDLDELSSRYSDVVHRCVTKATYGRQVRQAYCQQVDEFQRSIRIMHQHAQSNVRFEQAAKTDLVDAVSRWGAARQLSNRLFPNDQLEVAQLRRQIEPLMVKLQVVFSD